MTTRAWSGKEVIGNQEALTGWGGKFMEDQIRDRQWMKDAKVWLDEKNELEGLIDDKGWDNLSRVDRMSAECHYLMLWYLTYQHGENHGGLATVLPDSCEDDPETVIGLLVDYNLYTDDGHPTPAVRWVFEWLEDGAPEIVGIEGITPAWQPLRSGASFIRKNPPWWPSVNATGHPTR